MDVDAVPDDGEVRERDPGAEQPAEVDLVEGVCPQDEPAGSNEERDADCEADQRNLLPGRVPLNMRVHGRRDLEGRLGAHDGLGLRQAYVVVLGRLLRVVDVLNHDRQAETHR